jgi:glycerate kinase
MPFKKDLKTLFIGGSATNDGGIGMLGNFRISIL